MRISIFGNPDLKKDAIPIAIMPLLQKKFPDLEFVHQDPNEIGKPLDNPWIIIDTVIGLPGVRLITDLSTIAVKKRVSMHDYDLSMHLTLLKKIDPTLEIRIIGVPPDTSHEEAIKEVTTLLSSLLPRND